MDGPDLNLKLCDVFLLKCGMFCVKLCEVLNIALDRPVDWPADILCSSDWFYSINIQRITLDGFVDRPDLNLNLKLCNVFLLKCVMFKQYYLKTSHNII